MERFFGICILYLIALSSSAFAQQNNFTRLQYNAQGKFKIVHFTDLHYGSETADPHTQAVQNAVLDSEKPDLVVITGDLVSGYLWNRQDPDWFKAQWIKVVTPMVSRGIRWAIALGNHDVEGDLTGEEIIELDSSHYMSLTKPGPENIDGNGNYYLPIYNSKNQVSNALWMLDSGHRGCMGIPGWGCIQNSQVAWYKNESRHLTAANGRTIPGMAFFHIPLFEHLDLWNSQPVYGLLGESVGVCCSSVNTGMYAAMKEMDDIKHVFCGHDHNNDYYGDYYGINLGYGRKTGYGSYGPPLGWKHGARVLELSENDPEVKTWLRLEDHTVEVQRFYLSSKSHWAGCCDMEGHGKEYSLTTTLFLYLFNAAWILIALVCVCTCRQCYLHRKEKQQKKQGESLLMGTLEL